MSKHKIDPLIYVRMREHGSTNVEIARSLGVDEASVRRGLKAVGYNPNHMPLELLEDFAATLDRPLEHDTAKHGGIVVTADWHIPLTDYALVNQLFDHAESIGAKNLLVAGDWWNMDALSVYDNKHDAAGFPIELRYGTAAMEKAAGLFERVYFTWGNHDNRFSKLLQYELDFKQSMELLFGSVAPALMSKIVFSNLDYMVIHTPAGDYRVSHPKSYSSIPLANPRRQASKYLMHALSGHTHHFAFGYDVSGHYIAAELGGLHRKDATKYLQRTTNYPVWNQGYALIDSQGHLHMEGEGLSFSSLVPRP